MTDLDTKACRACFKDIDARATRCPWCTERQNANVADARPFTIANDAAQLHRDVSGRMLAGVCAGLAGAFGWNVTVVRVLFVVSLAVTGGLAFWAYLAMWLLVPFAPNGRSLMRRLIDTLSPWGQGGEGRIKPL